MLWGFSLSSPKLLFQLSFIATLFTFCSKIGMTSSLTYSGGRTHTWYQVNTVVLLDLQFPIIVPSTEDLLKTAVADILLWLFRFNGVLIQSFEVRLYLKEQTNKQKPPTNKKSSLIKQKSFLPTWVVVYIYGNILALRLPHSCKERH